jgi:hypothetical protein
VFYIVFRIERKDNIGQKVLCFRFVDKGNV